MTEELFVTVAFGAPDRQLEKKIPFLAGETILEAIHRSGILEEFPEIVLEDNAQGHPQTSPGANPEKCNKVGIYSKLCDLDDEPRPGDRIEIYRPLKIDPKQARRERAKK